MTIWFKEYCREQQLLLAMPFRDDVWRNQAIPAQEALETLITQLSPVVSTHCLHPSRDSYDDIWLRDTLPIWHRPFDAESWQGLLPEFDGWGGVQTDIDADRELAERLFSARIKPQPWRGEAGMFSHNGEWLLVGLNSLKQRNPSLTEWQLKHGITEAFNPLKPIFIDTHLSADETAGHIDNMALFIDDYTVLYSFTKDPGHPDYAACQYLSEQLSVLPASIRKIAVPLPYPVRADPSERSAIRATPTALGRSVELPLLCSYVNVIAIGKTLFVPRYGIDEDESALAILKRKLPTFSVITVAARELVLGGGGLHCITHSVPWVLRQSVSAGDHVL